jgi:hypothetical protein
MEYTTCLSEQLEVVIDDRNSAAAIMKLRNKLAIEHMQLGIRQVLYAAI